MTSVRKSPNMMSTTGRIPVMAAPTARPVKPASEMGASTIRSGPNSATSPASTLNGVPASATSSPITNTRSSRRSSSARASLTACPNVIRRVGAAAAGASGVDMVAHRRGVREVGVERELQALLHPVVDALLDRPQLLLGHACLLHQPAAEAGDRIVPVAPQRLLVGAAVVGAVDVPDVVAVVAVGVAEQKARAVPAPGGRDLLGRRGVHGAHVLAVHLDGPDAERAGAGQQVARGHVEVVGVLVVEVVLAHV